MPGVARSDSAIVSISPEANESVIYQLHHGIKPPISPRLSISWSRGNSLRISVFQQPQSDAEGENGGEIVELKIGNRDSELDDAHLRRIAYGSVSPFALLQSRKNSIAAISKMSSSSPYEDWWEYVREYSKEINSLLGTRKIPQTPAIEDPRTILKELENPTCLKAAWELMEIFYADKQSRSWVPERLVDWLADYDCISCGDQPMVHSKLVDFQKDLVSLQVVEDEPKYWEAISSALAVGWLDTVVKLMRLHGSYQLNQLGQRETENGLVEAVAVLISKMPRMRPDLYEEKLGECYNNKPDFIKAWEKWRQQIAKLDCSPFWLQCDHDQTKDGLKNMLQIMSGNVNVISTVTFHWIELFISHFLYIRPFTVGFESMHNLAQKCMQLKPNSSSHKLIQLITGILGENTEVILAECSRSFGSWMIAHAIELLTAGNVEADMIVSNERENLGGISLEELHRLVYAQLLSSHSLTWQIAPVYLTSCMKQGMGLLEVLLYIQPVQRNHVLLKSLEICRMYDLDSVSSNLMKIAGVHHWKQGRKGCGVFWLQQAGDEVRLNRIAQQLFDFVGKSFSDESFKQWEGLIELLGSECKTVGGLEFLDKYRDFKRSLTNVKGAIAADSARIAAESLILLMKNPSTPQRFWLPLLHDSLPLLNWKEGPLLNVPETNLLLNKIQELSIGKLRPDFVEPDLPNDALTSIRLALATNLGRAILNE